ncbi:O-antigen ligase family protein [Riemerella anatipestifer]|uniref:O-antigen ligase family protein n=1 Tax=Riemerella anatipestifer TaxID=34085 RepID=UPI0013727C93|nr:O-antigen ligase family protein [Riemerella anatipestifer]MBT0550283.1 O-antigen ligase family protein [Riemerella anatipestifer]MBT0556005.1 O-antigen ligase family protein [Riemerella anatipestifer]MBT0561043.1 O-antigen ligase family protein [Riemerella anatipestifer]NAV16450.1 hypothetical protein [Riemerella anatipestifer]UZX28343.1 O-antigen ligase family protein [Riemerella anatipestifer]
MLKKKTYQSILLALLLLSGTLKPYFYAYVGNIDLVLIFSFLAFIDMLISKPVFSKYSFGSLLLLLLFSIYSIFTIAYSPSIHYYNDKLVGFILCWFYLIYPLSIKKFNPNIFIKTYMFVIIPLALFFIRMKSVLWINTNVTSSVFMELRSNYLGIGLHLGILVIVMNYFKRYIYIQLLCLLLLFATSARGPFVFTLLVLLVINYKQLIYFFYNFKNYLKYLITPLLVMFFFREKIFIFFENAMNRFDSLSGVDNSLNERLDMAIFAFNQPFDDLVTLFFGNGFASFGYLYNGLDARAYPHNLLLEIFFELGLLGLLLFSVFLVLVLFKSIKNKTVFSFVLLFVILNSLKSYSLSDSWVLFAIMGMIISYKITPQVQTTITNNKLL